jgi:hypothetical protein
MLVFMYQCPIYTALIISISVHGFELWGKKSLGPLDIADYVFARIKNNLPPDKNHRYINS